MDDSVTDIPSGYIESYTGKLFHWRDPDVDILDIAHALSNICRFNGHTSYHFSIASHSILVSYLCELFHADPIEGLLHDASEAYACDIPTPIKLDLRGYKEAEKIIQTKITATLGLPSSLNPKVRQADLLSLYLEAEKLMPSGGKHYMGGRPEEKIMEAGRTISQRHYPIDRYDQEEVEEIFLLRYNTLKYNRQQVA